MCSCYDDRVVCGVVTIAATVLCEAKITHTSFTLSVVPTLENVYFLFGMETWIKDTTSISSYTVYVIEYIWKTYPALTVGKCSI